MTRRSDARVERAEDGPADPARPAARKRKRDGTFCGFDVGIEATKGSPLPNDLSVFVSRLTHELGPRETELPLLPFASPPPGHFFSPLFLSVTR